MRSPVAVGVALALGAAVAFGAATPIIGALGRELGPFTVAALLYAGAALVSALTMPMLRRTGRALRRSDAVVIAGVAVLGGAVAPSLLAWGVKRTGGVTASLALNFEAVFTLALGWLVFREGAGRRVIAGAAAMLLGGVLLGVATLSQAGLDLLGLGAVVLATVAWAGDNTVSRKLSEVDPSHVVLAKGLLGAALTAGLAALLGEPLPRPLVAMGLLGCGATGYGLSLRLYLLAQRRMGAGRTASVFAVAPFLGAVLAVALGEQSGGAPVAVAAGLFALGVYLHVTERHAHPHVHPATAHEHAHRHDDEHHDHKHEPPVTGEHTHWHEHGAREHTHEHAPDLHHDHGHA